MPLATTILPAPGRRVSAAADPTPPAHSSELADRVAIVLMSRSPTVGASEVSTSYPLTLSGPSTGAFMNSPG
jgi:hypothetical protein